MRRASTGTHSRGSRPAGSGDGVEASKGKAVSTAIPLPLASSPGLYGPAGWIDDCGVSSLIAPCLCAPSFADDFARFEGVGADEAAALVEILPRGNLADRQNNGPTVAELLTLAIKRPGVLLSGYIVKSPRWDERLSIDGCFIPAQDGLPAPCLHGPVAHLAWPRLKEGLPLRGARAMPDEIIAVPTHADDLAWWLWWD